MTLLVVPILVEDPPGLEPAVQAAFAQGGDAVELRIDTFDGDPALINDLLRRHGDRTFIVTCRSHEEGGHFRGDTMERVSRLIAAARGTDAFVDFEWADWQRSSNIRQKVLLAAARSDGSGHRLILSNHDFDGPPPDLRQRAAAMAAVPEAAVVKVAYTARDINDSFLALDLVHESTKPTIAIAMSEPGLITRVLAGKLDAFATFASLDADDATAPGQVTLAQMRKMYRYVSATEGKRINRNTRVYGVIGDPIGHSQSPAIHNRWFVDQGVNGMYLPLLVNRKEHVLAAFLDGLRSRPWLDVGGLSVTLPHKEAALRWVGHGADDAAERIGAINTLVFPSQDRATGHNTDGGAAVDALAEALGKGELQRGRELLASMAVDVLGAGGAARAVVAGLRDAGVAVTVWARDPSTATWATTAGATVRPWAEITRAGGDILINSTPVGMAPRNDESPVSDPALLSRYRLVYDLVYNPLQTRLLREAEAAGSTTLSGVEMFVRQAARQFELWTAIQPELARARRVLTAGCRRSIALIGYRGSGKSTVGRILAKNLGVAFVDTDEEIIAAASKSIAEIFAEQGEAGFRSRESLAVAAACERAITEPLVISVGGGAVLAPTNVEKLREVATVVWLTAPAEVLWQRLSSDTTTPTNRPDLTTTGGLEEVRQILRQRDAAYRAAADHVVDTGVCTAEAAAGKVEQSKSRQEQ